MRLFIGFLCLLLLSGCGATRQQVAANLGDQYVGKNVDAMVLQFGPPASSFRMNSGDTSYVWQLKAETGIDLSSDRYGNSSGTASTNYCKVNAIASPTGIVTRLTTEDTNSTGGLLGAAGVEVYGSICARHLGIRRENASR